MDSFDWLTSEVTTHGGKMQAVTSLYRFHYSSVTCRKYAL